MFHSHIHFYCEYGFLNSFVSVGAIAMTGFIMLSGFTLYYTNNEKDLCNLSEVKAFYIKRLITIVPLYYTIALIHVMYDLFIGHLPATDAFVLLPVEALGLQSTYFSLFGISHNSGTWFISCILICYAIYPYLQIILKQMSLKSQEWLLVIICIVLLYAPIVRLYFGLDIFSIYTNPFYRILEFLIGAILAKMVNTSSVWNFCVNKYLLFIIVIMMIAGVSMFKNYIIPNDNDYMLLNWVVVPCFILVIVNLYYLSLKSAFQSRLVLYLGSISYTFFLCQLLPLWGIGRYICDKLEYNDNFFKIIISLLICLIGAILIHQLVEIPASKFLKQQFLNHNII